MSVFNGTLDVATEAPTVVRVVLLALLVTVAYFCWFYCTMRWATSSAKQRQKSNRGNVADVKTPQSKQKNSTSAAVQLKDSNIKESTARLQEKKEIEPQKEMKKQQSNKTSMNLEDMITEQLKVQQSLKQEIRRQRQEIHLNKEIIQRQEKDKRREKQQELEKQQRKKKDKKKQAQKKREHLNLDYKPLKKQNAVPAIHDIAAAPTQSSKAVTNNRPSRPSLQDNKAVTEKRSCAENDTSAKVLRADKKHDKKLQEELKKHDTTIGAPPEEIEKTQIKYETLPKWTDDEFKTVIDGVHAESEMRCRDIIYRIKNSHDTVYVDLQMEHEAKVMELHMYYETMFATVQINHGLMVEAMQTNHNVLVNNLRNANFEQGKRHEAAMRSMRELRNKMREEHRIEVDGMRLKYDNMIKEHEIAIKVLIEQNELLCTEHERVVRDQSKMNQVLSMEIETITKSLRAENETGVNEALRNVYDSPVALSSPVLTIRNRTEVEGFQCNSAEEEQHHTTIAARQQTPNRPDDKDADTTTTTVADDDATDTLNSQETMVDHKQILNDTEQKLSQLHECAPSKDSNNLSTLSDLDDLEVDAR